MSQHTLDNSQHSNRPPENDETIWWRNFIYRTIWGLWNEKKEILANMGFPPRPVSQKEIFKRIQARVQMLKDEELWGTTESYPYRSEHNHNWVERRVNELAKPEFGPVMENGETMIVCVDKQKGLYEPNAKLFAS